MPKLMSHSQRMNPPRKKRGNAERVSVFDVSYKLKIRIVEKQVVSDVAGVIATVDAGNGATVEKDAKIATIYPNNAMQIKMVISEADLMDVTVGGKAEIEFNWDADSGRRFEGTISSISYLSEKKDDSAASQSAQYVAYVDFTPDETVRIGMTVIVYVE